MKNANFNNKYTIHYTYFILTHFSVESKTLAFGFDYVMLSNILGVKTCGELISVSNVSLLLDNFYF